MKRLFATVALTALMFSVVFSPSIEAELVEETTETQPIVDTKVRYLTDEELSKLYTCRQDIRYTNPNIVEVSQEDAVLLMQIARAESGDNLEGQMWTMRVILNRLAEGTFGNSIYDIVSSSNPTQFEVFASGAYKTVEIAPSTHIALANIEGGWNETDGALYFESATNSDESWHKTNRTFIKEVDGQRYYR